MCDYVLEPGPSHNQWIDQNEQKIIFEHAEWEDPEAVKTGTATKPGPSDSKPEQPATLRKRVSRRNSAIKTQTVDSMQGGDCVMCGSTIW